MVRAFPPFLPTLILINLTGHMALSGGRLSGSLFVLASGSSESWVGLFMAMFSVIPVMTSLAVGRWVDRAGSARVLKVGICFVLVGAWLPVIHLALPTMLVLAVTLGVGFNLVSLAAQHSVGHLDPQASGAQRLAHFGWFAMGHSASSALGPFVAGLLIDGVGFRAAFAALAGFSTVSALLVLARASGLPGPRPPAAPASGGSSRRAVPRVGDLLASSEMRRIYWVNMMTASGWDLFIVCLPVVGHRLGFSASVIGTVFSLFAVGTFAARATMPWLSRRANEWQILRAALAVMSVVFFLLPWAAAAPVLMMLGLVFGSAVGMSQPNMLSLLHTAAPAGRGGEAVGMRAVLSNGCSVVVPLAFGAALAGVGIPMLLAGGGLLVATGLLSAHRAALARRGH